MCNIGQDYSDARLRDFEFGKLKANFALKKNNQLNPYLYKLSSQGLGHETN